MFTQRKIIYHKKFSSYKALEQLENIFNIWWQCCSCLLQFSCPNNVWHQCLIAYFFLLPPFSVASLHSQCARWLRVHQPTCSEHSVWVCGDTTCPTADFQSCLASGAQLLSGGGAAGHQRRCHLWARTELRWQLSGCLPTLWVVGLFSDFRFCFSLRSPLVVAQVKTQRQRYPLPPQLH